jgi:hypothetical protein
MAPVDTTRAVINVFGRRRCHVTIETVMKQSELFAPKVCPYRVQTTAQQTFVFLQEPCLIQISFSVENRLRREERNIEGNEIKKNQAKRKKK